ncbi:MAG TPA: hypothetical protein VI916_06795 [Acidimicrobiia bacterium]|nr:hypothetical protein [Acidimicrobiia bacterium]
MTKPANIVCPLCLDDELQFEALGPGGWTVQCPPHRDHPAGGVYRRQTTLIDDAGLEEAAGITEDLGLYDDLPRCLVVGEPWKQSLDGCSLLVRIGAS